MVAKWMPVIDFNHAAEVKADKVQISVKARGRNSIGHVPTKRELPQKHILLLRCFDTPRGPSKMSFGNWRQRLDQFFMSFLFCSKHPSNSETISEVSTEKGLCLVSAYVDHCRHPSRYMSYAQRLNLVTFLLLRIVVPDIPTIRSANANRTAHTTTETT